MDVTNHCVTHRHKLRTKLLACVAQRFSVPHEALSSEAALFVFTVPVPSLSSSASKPHGLFGSLPFAVKFARSIL